MRVNTINQMLYIPLKQRNCFRLFSTFCARSPAVSKFSPLFLPLQQRSSIVLAVRPGLYILRLLRLHLQNVSLSHRRQTNHFFATDFNICFQFLSKYIFQSSKCIHLIENSYSSKELTFFFLSREKLQLYQRIDKKCKYRPMNI